MLVDISTFPVNVSRSLGQTRRSRPGQFLPLQHWINYHKVLSSTHSTRHRKRRFFSRSQLLARIFVYIRWAALGSRWRRVESIPPGLKD